MLIPEGEICIQAGREANGRNSLTKAVEIAQSRTDISPVASMALQTSILKREEVMLRNTHDGMDAKLVEEQINQLQSAAPAACSNCTVPVTSLPPQ